MGIKAQRNRQAAILKQCRELSEGSKDEPFSEEQQAEYDGLMADHKSLGVSIAREEELKALEAQAPVIEPPSAPPVTPAITPVPTEPEKFATFGEQLRAIIVASRNGGYVDPRLGPQSAITGSGTVSGDDGGFLAQQDFSAEILRRTFEQGAILSRVRKIPISPGSTGIKINAVDDKSRATGSRWGGVQVYRVEEGGQYTASRPKMRQISLTLKKLIGLWYATDELMSDASAMEAVAMDAFAEEFTFVLEDEILNATGGAQMAGIIASAATVSVTKETNQVADTVVKENIDKMWSRCWGRSRLNSVWFINQTVEPQLFGMTQDVGTGGIPVYLPPGGLSATPYGSLYGRPVIPVEQCQKLGDNGDIILADLSQYVMIDDGAPKTASSIHLRFDYGEQVFRWTMRNDGQPIWAAPLTPYKGGSGATLSPFVTLAAR